MTDVVDPQTRSRMMSGIGGKDTQPELRLRTAMHRRGLRFRLHVRDLPGRPDIVLPRHRLVVLVHGCFWHRHAGCRYATTPKTRPEFWEAKFTANAERDARDVGRLEEMGWSVHVAWECDIRRDVESVADGILKLVSSNAGA